MTYSRHSIPTPSGQPDREGAAPPPKLLDRMRIHLRTQHYSIRTEEAYVDWARRFILFHRKRHPQDMGAAQVEAFLSYLAVERNVAASTQNQAKAALLYLCLPAVKSRCVRASAIKSVMPMSAPP